MAIRKMALRTTRHAASANPKHANLEPGVNLNGGYSCSCCLDNLCECLPYSCTELRALEYSSKKCCVTRAHNRPYIFSLRTIRHP